eukprot:403335157
MNSQDINNESVNNVMRLKQNQNKQNNQFFSIQEAQSSSNNQSNKVSSSQHSTQQHMFKQGVGFDQIFQKDYFEDVLNPPESSIEGFSSQNSSPPINQRKFNQNTNRRNSNSNGKVSQNHKQSISDFQNASSPLNNFKYQPIRESYNGSGMSSQNILNSYRKSDQSQRKSSAQKKKQSLQEEESIMESMSQLLKAVNQLKLAKDESPARNKSSQRQISTIKNDNRESQQSLNVMQDSENFTQSNQSNPFAKYLDNALQRVENIQSMNHNPSKSNLEQQKYQSFMTSSLAKSQSNSQLQQITQDVKPDTPNNKQIKDASQSAINFQFKTMTKTNLTNQSKSPKQVNFKKQNLNKSKSPLRAQFLNPLKQKSPINFGNKTNISKNGKSSNSRSPKTSATRSQLSQNDPSQDVINRLFMNHKKTQEMKDKKRYVKLQQELNLLQDKPQISDKSQRIIMNSVRQHQPIHSPERYYQEIDNLKNKKEQAVKLKELKDREKELQEEEEMLSFHQNTIGKKINMHEFQRKYENQVRKWEAKQNGKFDESIMGFDVQEKNSTFKPQINQKSKLLAKNIKKIEDRVNILQESKKNKLQKLEMTLQPSFTPQINKNTDKLLNDTKSFISGSSPLIKSLSRQHLQKREFETLKNQEHSPISKNRSSSNMKTSLNEIKENQVISVKKKQPQQTSRSPILMARPSNQIQDVKKQQEAKNETIKPQQIVSTLQSQEWTYGMNQELKLNFQNSKDESPITKQTRISDLDANKNDSSQNNYMQKLELDTKNLEMLISSINQSGNNQLDGQHIDILKEYIKLKDEFNISLSNRNSNAPIQSQMQQQNQLISQRPSDLKFEDSPFKRNISQSSQQQVQQFKVVKSQRQNSHFSPDRLDKTRQNNDDEGNIRGNSPSQYSTIQDNLQVREFDVVLSEDTNQLNSIRKSGGIEPYRSQSPNRYNSSTGQLNGSIDK